MKTMHHLRQSEKESPSKWKCSNQALEGVGLKVYVQDPYYDPSKSFKALNKGFEWLSQGCKWTIGPPNWFYCYNSVGRMVSSCNCVITHILWIVNIFLFQEHHNLVQQTPFLTLFYLCNSIIKITIFRYFSMSKCFFKYLLFVIG